MIERPRGGSEAHDKSWAPCECCAGGGVAGVPAGEVRRARRGGGAGRRGWPRRASVAAAGSTVPRHGAAAAAGPRSPPAHGWALAVTPLTPRSLHGAISHQIIPYIKFANGNSDSFPLDLRFRWTLHYSPGYSLTV